jgi:Holliday junction DNA helicase RuvA
MAGMIEYIRGRLTDRELDYIVVETSGIGYRVYTGNPFSFEGGEVLVHTYYYVREDMVALYGFKTRQERDLFAKLLQVSGIGPKAAMAIVAVANPSQIALAIQQEDLPFLTRFPGVGRKTAQRLIVDLKDKLDDLINEAVPEKNKSVSWPGENVPEQERSAVAEASSALEALGYSSQEIHRLVPQLKKLADDGLNTQDLIKHGLRMLMK